ncbi:helix-turn-helix transcriptional regulator [Lysinibacillus capsici]|uniref:helix-turn-helix domain-containing protein n=1 Tax=Lysinibacillus capsici TaxID=2115968 RepID=UPI0032E44C87
MSVFEERIKKLRGSLSIDELANKFNEKYQTKISKSMISRYENGLADPKMDVLRIYADYFNVSLDYLTGLSDVEEKPFNPELTEKDERDIQKELQKMIDGLNSGSFAAFDGQTLDDMDDEDRELLIASLENSLRLAKRIAKQKFTPKKFRK